jgi:hypothetical protein
LFERLLSFNPKEAKREYSVWPIHDNYIFDRLRIWATGFSNLLPAHEFSSAVLVLSNDVFWDSYSRRDLLMIMAKRWNQLSDDLKIPLEKRILDGRDKWDDETDEDYHKRSAYMILDNLHWLSQQGCQFTFDFSAETLRLRAQTPEWTEQKINSAVETIGVVRGGMVSYNEDHSPLLTQSISEILPTAEQLSGRSDDFLVENAPFKGLCTKKPVRAFSALTYSAKSSKFPKWAWDDFLYSPARENDKPRFTALIASRLANYAPENLSEILYPTTNWIKKKAKTLADNYSSIYFNKSVRFNYN